MREILFRGKRTDNGEWVYGDFCHPCNIVFVEIGYDEVLGQSDVPIIHDYGVIPETVGQCTGLVDKNGKKVFEGDIGKYKQTDGAKRNGKPIICTGKVVYFANTASYAVDSKDECRVRYIDYFPIKHFEIIGNIHDNPELLEVQNNG